MPLLDAETTPLLLIDFQTRLMPAIAEGEAALANAKKLLDSAGILKVPSLATEQYAKGLGPTMAVLAATTHPTFHKMTFDACATAGFLEALPAARDVIVAGCEAHVCVLQTVFGLLDAGRKVHVVRDAVGSRTLANREAALHRMERHGAELVTTEMVVFEWLRSSQHTDFKAVSALIK